MSELVFCEECNDSTTIAEYDSPKNLCDMHWRVWFLEIHLEEDVFETPAQRVDEVGVILHDLEMYPIEAISMSRKLIARWPDDDVLREMAIAILEQDTSIAQKWMFLNGFACGMIHQKDPSNQFWRDMQLQD